LVLVVSVATRFLRARVRITRSFGLTLARLNDGSPSRWYLKEVVLGTSVTS
jgi:hypothetical protein